MNEKTRYLTINLMNGKKHKFEFLPIASDLSTVTSALEKIMTSGHVILKCDDRLHIIPLANIESMEVWPAPEKLPSFVVKAVKEF